MDMKLKILLGGFFALTLLFSCSDEVRIKRKKNRVVLKPSLIRMSHYFTEFEDEVSFPVWFDDSLIRENRIKKIVRKTFLLNEDTLALQLPKTVKEYGFEENGRIISFEVIQFYEGREVSTMKFTYPKGIDEYGFAEVKTSVPDKVLDQSQYRIYQPEKYATDFLVYRNVSEGTYLFCMTNEAYFGPLSVDSILKPTSYDLVMLGSPIYPLKRYRVENRVNESDVVELEYDRKTIYQRN